MKRGGNSAAAAALGVPVGNQAVPAETKYTSQKAVVYKNQLAIIQSLESVSQTHAEAKAAPVLISSKFSSASASASSSAKTSRLGAVKGKAPNPIEVYSPVESARPLDSPAKLTDEPVLVDERLGFGQVSTANTGRMPSSKADFAPVSSSSFDKGVHEEDSHYDPRLDSMNEATAISSSQFYSKEDSTHPVRRSESSEAHQQDRKSIDMDVIKTGFRQIKTKFSNYISDLGKK